MDSMNYLFQEQIAFLYRQSRLSYIALIILSAILIYGLYGTIDPSLLAGWFGLNFFVIVFRYILHFRYVGEKIRTVEFNHRFYRLFVIGSLASSLVWGVGALALFPENSIALQGFMLLLYGGIAAGAFVSLGTRRPLYLMYILIILSPLLYRILVSNNSMDYTMSSIIAFYMLFLYFSSKNYAKLFVEALEIKLHNSELLHELSVSKNHVEKLNRKLETKLEHSIDELKRQQAVIFQQSKLSSMGEMIGNIAHQWRQPLNALGLNIQNLEMTSELGELNHDHVLEMVNSSMKQINYMSKTIDDFRNFISTNEIISRIDINTAVDEAIDLVALSLNKHGIVCNIAYSEENATVLGSSSEFKQVIINLLNNSKDAFENHQIEIKKINIEINKDDKSIIIVFEDNAGGIPDNVIKRIFEPYFTTKEEGKGTGIGLYMSYMIIHDKMGGTIDVHNTEFGAKFTISVPISL